MSPGRTRAVLGAASAVGVLLFWFLPRPGDVVEVTVPEGATLSEVADSLAARNVIRGAPLFELYVRLRGADRDIKAGRYELATGASWTSTVRRLRRGEVMTQPLTIPEGLRLEEIAPRIAEATGVSVDSVMRILESPRIAEELGVPGPGLEGYLFPDTYRFAEGVPVKVVLEAMADRYRAVWTPERRERLDSLGLSERELVTLASIVQAEARRLDEMSRIAGVYHNRLDRGWLLQADPTVIYALGGYRARLLFAAIDSVAESPYNTYTQEGLPPGPIGAPGEAAIHAALNPTGDYLYFVARPDGSHVFTRSLADHNRARLEAAREAQARGS